MAVRTFRTARRRYPLLRWAGVVAVGIAMLGVAACGAVEGVGDEADQSTEDECLPVIVVTANILGDITDEIAGDHAEVNTLMAPNADPHSFGISAAQAERIEEADGVHDHLPFLTGDCEAGVGGVDGDDDGEQQVGVAGDVVDDADHGVGGVGEEHGGLDVDAGGAELAGRGAPDPHPH